MVENMKKTTIYRLLVTLNYLIFAVALTLVWVFDTRFGISIWWFPMLLWAISISLFIKFALFRSENFLWFALYLLLTGGYFFLSVALSYPSGLWPIYVLIPCLVSAFMASAYKSLWHLCLTIAFLFLGAPLFLISFGLLKVWWFLIVYATSLVFGFFCINFVYNLVRGVYGKI